MVQSYSPGCIPQTASRLFQPFFEHIMAKGPCTLQWAAPFPLKIATSHLMCGSFGPPKSTTQTASRSVKPFFTGLTIVTDHATPSVTIDCIIMAALHSRCGHYIFVLWCLSSFFIPRLISAIAHWMSARGVAVVRILECRSEMCCTRLAGNAGPKSSPSGHRRTTLSGYIFATKVLINNRKKIVKQQYLLHMSSQYGEWTSAGPTNGWDLLASFGHPIIFQRVSRLGSVTARHSSSGCQPNFAALNRGRHLHLAVRPSHWALAHISSLRMYYCNVA